MVGGKLGRGTIHALAFHDIFMAMQAATPMFRSFGHALDLSPDRFGYMRESNELLKDIDGVRQRIAEDGYLLLRNYLDRDEVLAARRDVMSRLKAEQMLDPERDLMEGILRRDAKVSFRADLASGNAFIARVLYSGRMMEFFARFFGEPVRHFDYTWMRAISPGFGTPSHCDIVYMGRGSKRLYTAWTPLGDISFDLGGLIVLEGSHRHERLRETYCKSDVNAYCLNAKNDRRETMLAREQMVTGHLSKDPVQIQHSLGGRWLASEFSAGDVVIFSTYLVHGGLDNSTANQLRLSTDSRYQPASDPADERWIGPNPPAHGPRANRGLIC